MAARSIELDKAIEAYFSALPPLSANSIGHRRRVLDALTEAAGRSNASVRNMGRRVYQDAVVLLRNGATPEQNRERLRQGLTVRKGRGEATLATDRTVLRGFIKFCHERGWGQNMDPFFEIARSTKDVSTTASGKVREKRKVDFEQWPELLRVADAHRPRTRMAVAMGLLWGLRVSSMVAMLWRDIDLERGKVTLRNIKRGRLAMSGDRIISPWMRDEILRYKAWYVAQNEGNEPNPDHPVLPVLVNSCDLKGWSWPKGRRNWPARIGTPASTRDIRLSVQETLKNFGWTDDMIAGEGTHTLRRSNGTMLAVRAGRPAAQAGLDHERADTTDRSYVFNVEGKKALDEFEQTLTSPEAAQPAPVPAQPTVVQALDDRLGAAMARIAELEARLAGLAAEPEPDLPAGVVSLTDRRRRLRAV